MLVADSLACVSQDNLRGVTSKISVSGRKLKHFSCFERLLEWKAKR